MTFWKTVRAYLTGFLIVQPLYQVAFRWWRKRELAEPNAETRLYFQHIADMLLVMLAPKLKSAVYDGLYATPKGLYTATSVRTIAFEAAGAATTPFMEDHPNDVMPSERVIAGVNAVLESHGLPEQEPRDEEEEGMDTSGRPWS